jgi:hypothetical protein
MIATTPVFLEALADCLEAGNALEESLGMVAAAGPAAAALAGRVRRSTRRDQPVAAALRDSGLVDDDERAMLDAAGVGELIPELLRALAVRRRRRVGRRWTLLRGLVGPFVVGAITAVLDPLPNVVSGGDFVLPAVRGLLLVIVLSAASVLGVGALFTSRRTRGPVLRVVSSLPGAAWLAGLYAEEELTTKLMPFAGHGAVTDAGLAAAAVALDWSPLVTPLRVGARTDDARKPLGGLEPIARLLSLDTNLAVVGGVAARRLAERLRQRSDAIADVLTSRIRLLVRLGAYGIVIVWSTVSILGTLVRGVPGMPTLPGGAVTGDEKQLEELLKQLQQQ